MLCLDFEINSHECTRFVLRSLKRLSSCLLLMTSFAALGPIAFSQSSNGADSGENSPRFASSSLTRAASREPGNSMRVKGRTFTARNLSLIDLVAFAWNLHPTQIQGGPEWSHEERFDLIADAGTDSEPDVEQWRAMVRELVARRFRIKAHREKKLLDAFVLSRAGQSPHMTVDSSNPDGLPSISISSGELTARNATMADLAETLQRSVLDAPVLDRTGLTDKYDFTLEWGADPKNESNRDDAGVRNLKSAMQNLALGLERRKVSADVFVLDDLSRPALD